MNAQWPQNLGYTLKAVAPESVERLPLPSPTTYTKRNLSSTERCLFGELKISGQVQLFNSSCILRIVTPHTQCSPLFSAQQVKEHFKPVIKAIMWIAAIFIDDWNLPHSCQVQCRKTIFQKGKRRSSLLWKAFPISSYYFLLHRHFKLNLCKTSFALVF